MHTEAHVDRCACGEEKRILNTAVLSAELEEQPQKAAKVTLKPLRG